MLSQLDKMEWRAEFENERVFSPLLCWPDRYCSVNPWIKSSHMHSLHNYPIFFIPIALMFSFLFFQFVCDEFVDGLRLVNGTMQCHLSVKLGVIVMEMPRFTRSSTIHQFIFALQSWTWLPHGAPSYLCVCVCVWVLQKWVFHNLSIHKSNQIHCMVT